MEDLWPPLRGFRNGLLFGTRIRLVDGFVKALLYHKGSVASAVKQVVDITFEHGSSLGTQVCLHKLVLLLLFKIKKQEEPWHWAIGGVASGALVWGRSTRFNEMLNLYLFSRVLVAWAKTIEVPSLVQRHAFRVWSTFIWAAVMYQFRVQQPLQITLVRSMQYLHDDSLREGWASWGAHLGSGAKSVPYLVLLVSVAKVLLRSDKSPPSVPRAPSYPENMV